MAEELLGSAPDATPKRPPSARGRAHTFRVEQEERSLARRELAYESVVVVILLLGVYTIVTAQPGGVSGYVPPSYGPTIEVQLGTPSGSSVTCGAGGTAYAEKIPWVNSTQPVTTGDVNVRVYEIWDGDIIPDFGVVANATPTDVCAGAAPGSPTAWYVVLQAPNGTNLLTYNAGHNWKSVTDAPWNFWVENGSAIVVVTGSDISGTGRGFAVLGFANGSPVKGSIPL
ncbi:MAG TPA: hypothetical protein VEH57_08605 [Thermoplasmata archaeon]|nr:hypothetical protein [Thermoplasmata archaeon]